MGPGASQHNFFNQAMMGVGIHISDTRQRELDKQADDQRKLDAQTAAQAKQAETLRIETLQQPKKITPDNFMAQKSKQLAQLRLGMGSTVTGAGNPTLQPAPAALKSKMGA